MDSHSVPLNDRVRDVTDRIRARSEASRTAYLERMDAARRRGVARSGLGCANLAHGFAAAQPADKAVLRRLYGANIAIVSAYNDMLSALQPFERFPALIKSAAREVGAVAQFAGGVPAMCDGVTQGQPGMELSLFSRDVIAMATAIALSHNMFDAALCLGICDKIVPGLLMGALAFGHLPVVFVPSGPMPSGLPNKDKARVRQLFAQGQVGRDALLECETQSYHGPGTCTFYGTANSNQMLMKVMGLHMPGAAFVAPNTPLRDALTAAATARAADITALGRGYRPLADVVDERAGERDRRPDGDRRLDESHDPSRGDRARRGREPHLGRLQRSLGSGPAADAHLSERQRRRESLPRRGRHGLPRARAAGRGTPASGHDDGHGSRSERVRARAVALARRPGVAVRTDDHRRPERPASRP